MDNKINIWSSISSTLDGCPTQEEKQQVEEWKNENEKNKMFFDRLQSRSFNPEIEEQAAGVQDIIYIKTREKINRAVLKRKLRLWQYVAAASVTLLFIVSGLSILQVRPTVEPVYVESKSPMGSVTRLTLSDGTIVDLNAGSTLSYPLAFTEDHRSVTLTGEAYFEVAKNTKQPFIVETGQMKVQVLGTHFNVKSYQEDNRLTTTLVEGSVSVSVENPDAPASKPIILKPNQQITLDRTTREVNIAEVDAGLYSSWKDGECYFENEKLKDIVKILERQFGIPISITGTHLEEQVFSGFFTRKEGLFHILNSFKRNRNLDYRQSETGVEIYPREK